MGPDELFEATAQAMLAALDRDASSGYGVVIYTITKVIFYASFLILSISGQSLYEDCCLSHGLNSDNIILVLIK
jgi:hypothetical protein